MRQCKGFLLLFVVSSFTSLFSQAWAQVDHITIAAGTDEDHALQAITNEQDNAKKITMYQDFVQKFSSNPQAVAYGNWQLAQLYQANGDLDKAMDAGDKAVAASPHNLDILTSQVSLAQQAKNNLKTMDYAAKGGNVCHSIGKQPKPQGMNDDEFAQQVNQEKASVQNSCEFLETSGFNVITVEQDPKNRMTEIEQYTAAFPDSKFSDQVSNYAMYTLGPGQLNDQARLVSFGEKTLATDPNSLPALLLLASYYSDEKKPGSTAKAITYAQKAIEVAKPDAPDADKSRKAAAGAAHNTIGWAYLNEQKTASAIPELKSASALLKGQDDQQYARALYGLGFAYGKLNRLTEAREVLTEAVKIPGPLQAMSQDLLTKVNSARAKGK
ncbi:MAG TPA: tetratricopeptide repeat protein [Candidatus Sulfotelmatobacter sp.]|nr:tetratricopeptide repeat protein [Candidatus Sulfotelmatobacter sp.]